MIQKVVRVSHATFNSPGTKIIQQSPIVIQQPHGGVHMVKSPMIKMVQSGNQVYFLSFIICIHNFSYYA